MQKLIEGVHQFRQEEFARYRELFRDLSRKGQHPHTLFITCCDSRVIAELITKSQPGDLFVVKNIGNIVPRHDVVGTTNSTAAAVEYAVHALGVSNIVVCGHTQCGGMQALLEGTADADALPHVVEWLKTAAPVRETIETRYSHVQDPQDRVTAAAQENVLFALENLHTYPAVARRLADGSLRLHGWCFKIATAELFGYDPEAKQFTQIVETV